MGRDGAGPGSLDRPPPLSAAGGDSRDDGERRVRGGDDPGAKKTATATASGTATGSDRGSIYADEGRGEGGGEREGRRDIDDRPAGDRGAPAATFQTADGVASDLFHCLSAYARNAKDGMLEMRKSIERSCTDARLIPPPLYDLVPGAANGAVADLFLLRDGELDGLGNMLGTEFSNTEYFNQSFVEGGGVPGEGMMGS